MSDSLNIEIAMNSKNPDISISMESSGITYENNYEALLNIPRINNIPLIGNKTTADLGLQDELPIITRAEIREIIRNLQ